MEYFYEDALRWSYGFDNPNKAAVLFACGLALAWMLWMLAWRLRSGWWRGLAVVLSAGAVLGVAFLLFKTYSRGGAVAAGCAVAYLIVQGAWVAVRAKRGCGARYLARDAVLVGAVLGLFWGTGLAGRSLEPLEETGDASVENRLVLWRSALQMAADNPAGFGLGKSGEAYMNWYQPVEMTAGYRTLVNSYLTALVEWGWPVFAGAVLLAGFFWGWANPGRAGSTGADLAAGLRAVVLAFAMAGVFSTTMEEGGLWIFPGICGVALIGWTVVERRSMRMAIPSVVVGAVACAMFLASGAILSGRDGERREFYKSENGEAIVGIGPKKVRGGEWTVVPDAEVLGEVYGKLVRPLANGLGARVNVDSASGGSRDRLIIAGASSGEGKFSASSVLVLLAPAVMPREQADRLLGGSPRIVLFVPGIDEDGRTEFWNEAASSRKNVEIVKLEGVGRQLDWGWDQVIERLRTEFKSEMVSPKW